MSQDWYFTKYPPVIWWFESEVKLKLEKIIIKHPYDVIHRNVKRFDHQTTRFVSIKQIFVRIRFCAKYVFGEIFSHLLSPSRLFFLFALTLFFLVAVDLFDHAFICTRSSNYQVTHSQWSLYLLSRIFNWMNVKILRAVENQRHHCDECCSIPFKNVFACVH